MQYKCECRASECLACFLSYATLKYDKIWTILDKRWPFLHKHMKRFKKNLKVMIHIPPSSTQDRKIKNLRFPPDVKGKEGRRRPFQGRKDRASENWSGFRKSQIQTDAIEYKNVIIQDKLCCTVVCRTMRIIQLFSLNTSQQF